MTILLTGCAGMIGWKTTELLLAEGHSVVGVDNIDDYYSAELKLYRLSTLFVEDDFVFYKKDITDSDEMATIFAKHQFDAVINLAARPGVRPSIDNPLIYFQTNTIGCLTLLECCKKYNVRKFVLASTSSIYGLNETPFEEAQPTDLIVSPYAASKKSAEALCSSYHYLIGMDIVIPRYFTVYGPAGRPDMAVAKFIKLISRGEPITVYGDGEQLRDFTFNDDIARGTIACLNVSGFEIINLGNSKPERVNYLIQLIENEVGREALRNTLPPHPADVPATWANIDKAKRLLNWQPTTSLSVGIMETVKWRREG